MPRRRRPKSRDMALIFDRTEDRKGFQVLRRRAEDHPLEVGTIHPLQEGKPVDGEVVTLDPRPDFPFLCDVRTELADPRRSTSVGPPQVATEEYRRGWDAIWGQRAPASKPN